MIADEALADALGLLAFIVFLNMANFAAKSFENLTPLDGDKHIRCKSTGNRSTGQE